MNIKDISTQLLYTTVPIWGMKKDKSQVSGTGFIYNYVSENDSSQSIPLLITNYHVLDGVVNGVIEFALQKNGEPVKGESVKVDFDSSVIRGNKLDGLDLIALPIAPVLNNLREIGKEVFFKSITREILPNSKQIEELSALEEITFIGYPSGLYDNYNVSSIIRRGITATPIWNDFKGERAFLIDAGVFPGSSGSPVFILNQGSYSTNAGISIGSRIYFIGVLTESMVREGEVFLGLGKVINSSVIKERLDLHISEVLLK